MQSDYLVHNPRDSGSVTKGVVIGGITGLWAGVKINYTRNNPRGSGAVITAWPFVINLRLGGAAIHSWFIVLVTNS